MNIYNAFIKYYRNTIQSDTKTKTLNISESIQQKSVRQKTFMALLVRGIKARRLFYSGFNVLVYLDLSVNYGYKINP